MSKRTLSFVERIFRSQSSWILHIHIFTKHIGLKLLFIFTDFIFREEIN